MIHQNDTKHDHNLPSSDHHPSTFNIQHFDRLKQQLGCLWGKLRMLGRRILRSQVKMKVQDVEPKFKTDDDVIAIGDVFFSNVEQEWVVQPSGPIAHKCKTLIETGGSYDDKTICAMSNMFIGAFGSTFIEDILRLRKDILRLRKDRRLASVCDEYLCQGEEPNFIAGDE
ncbi:hypothetical protein QYF36_023679 [Acer negundo]|nr:hypothetical protein QYF36_023679 [Acer negundo]